ncbi:DNA polymerase III subunit delta [Estrella lausannensis]|uniref:DNA-directed DNA polymerase n=1 Tax=Estrella lausannensis TaxID=483423 RepID=A0A0H5DRL1_9BACT|nr:DNA polymerase III subunit delta [Estrella lausannensis]CRX39232.1 DNA polymerase III subunit delta [Estrella lausannensis]
MKYDSLRAFQKHLQSASPSHFSSTYLLLSKEPFDLKEAVTLLSSALGSGVTVIRLNPEKEGVAPLLNELLTLSLFQGMKLVVVEEADKIAKKEQERLNDWIKGSAKGACLALVSSSLRKNSALFQLVEKYGVILDVPEVKPWAKEKQAVEWILSKAEERKASLDPAAAALLVEWIGSDKDTLLMELEKLTLYTDGKRKISCKDVSALSEAVSKESVFKLAEALFNRDARKAISIQSALKREGIQAIAEIKMLRQQFEVELQVAILASEGHDEAIAALFPYMKGFILQQHKKQALTYGAASLRKGLIAIDKAELMLKSVPADPEMIVDKLIAELC